MTDREIIEKLATEFMGWHSVNTQWLNANNGIVARDTARDTWNPLVNPYACALVLDEIERRGWFWQWSYDWETTSCIIFKRPGDGELSLVSKLGSVMDDNRYRAVCLAALKACEVTEL